MKKEKESEFDKIQKFADEHGMDITDCFDCDNMF